MGAVQVSAREAVKVLPQMLNSLFKQLTMIREESKAEESYRGRKAVYGLAEQYCQLSWGDD